LRSVTSSKSSASAPLAFALARAFLTIASLRASSSAEVPDRASSADFLMADFLEISALIKSD
jgi:hypothetical protein